MRGESMKGKSKKSTYSTTFGVDPIRSIKNGDDEVRTHDPHNAIVVLFQLSYVPESFILEQKE